MAADPGWDLFSSFWLAHLCVAYLFLSFRRITLVSSHPFLAMSVSMSGFLDKAGEKGLGAKRCKTRWFEVVGTNMNYFKTRGGSIVGVIDLKTGT